MAEIVSQDNIQCMGNQYSDLVFDYYKNQTGRSNLISENCEIPSSYLSQSLVIPKSKKHNPDTPYLDEALSDEHQVQLRYSM